MTVMVWPARENLQSFSALWRFEQGQLLLGYTGPAREFKLPEALPPAHSDLKHGPQLRGALQQSGTASTRSTLINFNWDAIDVETESK
jgi:hypothetical protein